MRDGHKFVEEADYPFGEERNPMDDAALEAKI
jgi:hypothetical protein